MATEEKKQALQEIKEFCQARILKEEKELEDPSYRSWDYESRQSVFNNCRGRQSAYREVIFYITKLLGE